METRYTTASAETESASDEASGNDSSLFEDRSLTVHGPPPTSIATKMTFAASAERAWQSLMFYEQIDDRPPLHLRLLLPVPIRTIGNKSQVGDEARCVYDGGHLIKRVVRVVPARLYAFEIVEQSLRIGGGMRLSGGDYSLDERAPDCTEVRLTTRYVSEKRPRLWWAPLEAAVCHAFHRHILGAMRRSVESH